MAKAVTRKKKVTANGDQMDLFAAGKKGRKRKSLRKGEERRYRTKKGHMYVLQRVD